MARIRSIKPETFSSYTLARVSIEARFLFVGLWTEADDEGRLIDSPKRIAGSIFPHDAKVTEKHVESWLRDLVAIGCIQRYLAGEGAYIAIPNWEKHQKISHPTTSKLPNFSGELREVFSPDLGTGNREQGTGKSKASHDADFDLWYSTYPRHEARQGALKAYRSALARSSVDALLTGATRYRDDPNRDAAYTKLPATWLNQGCWEDDSLPSRLPSLNGNSQVRQKPEVCEQCGAYADKTCTISGCHYRKVTA